MVNFPVKNHLFKIERETVEKSVKCVQSYMASLLNFEHITHQFSFVFIVKIEQVNISWVRDSAAGYQHITMWWSNIVLYDLFSLLQYFGTVFFSKLNCRIKHQPHNDFDIFTKLWEE